MNRPPAPGVLATLLATLLATALLAGCEQDPLLFRALRDGGPQAPDTFLPDLSDATSDLPPDFRPDLEYDACRAQLEVCNNVDDNCDGQIDENLDKLNDAQYCESCRGCAYIASQNAVPRCQQGTCVIASCVAGYTDLNKDKRDGCEHLCAASGPEICDGKDNDCDGLTDAADSDLVPLAVNICQTRGACASDVAGNPIRPVCQGADGWICPYGPGVELQPCVEDTECGTGARCVNKRCPNLVIFDETRCDGIDGDCDGLADDPWADLLEVECDPNPTPCSGEGDCAPLLGSTCGDNGFCTAKQGICADVGRIRCKANKSGSECQLVQAGAAPEDESCNGKDDDCNGLVDDDLDATAEQWVAVDGYQIFRFEASRPDATNSAQGSLSARPCSVPDRLPWTSVTREEAADACARADARLCTVTEWANACRGQSQTLYPYGATFDPAVCNGRAYDDTQDVLLPSDEPAGCVSSWGGAAIHNMSGNAKEWVTGGPSGHELRGGGFDTLSLDTAGAGMSCDYELPAPETTLRLDSIGFRCCK